MIKLMNLFLVCFLLMSFAQAKTKRYRKVKKVRVKSSKNQIFKKSLLKKRYNLNVKTFYKNSGLQSNTAPYRVGVLHNIGVGISGLVEYRYKSYLSLMAGPAFSTSKKSEEEGFFHREVTSLKLNEYKIDGYILLNLNTGMTLFRPYFKLGVGYGDFLLSFSSENEGFSDLNDSIHSIKGGGLLTEFGVGAELFFYRGLGMFTEVSYRSFNVNKVDYNIKSELADYEQSLLSKKQGAKFSGVTVGYGISLRF